MVLINGTRKDSCENARTCVTYCSIDSHGRPTCIVPVSCQSGAANVLTLGRSPSRATPQRTPTVLSKQHAELFLTDRITRILREIRFIQGHEMRIAEKPSKGCIVT